MTDLFKYPSTPHMPWSPGASGDDKTLSAMDHFKDKIVVITEKMDGENATLYRDHYHARSLDSRHHPSRDWIKAYWGQIRFSIPGQYRFCGENLYAQHSIIYDNLPSYFMLFNVWDQDNFALSWEDTETWAYLLNMISVPVIYKGIYSEEIIHSIISSLDLSKQEGIVLRNAETFHFDDFGKNMAKWVRKGHVQTEKHWMHAEIKPNGLLALKETD